MSDVSRALEQIAEIHGHLARTSVYRGWRPIPVALSGAIGLAGVVWQAAGDPVRDSWTFVARWSIVAAVALAVGCSEVVWHYLRSGVADSHRTRHVVGQLMPALVGGAIVTVSLIRANPAMVSLLPGLWALSFGSGIFAARPYLPRGSGWAALFYWTAGLVMLSDAVTTGLGAMPSPWSVGGVFGAGQLVGAAVLWKERTRLP